MDDDAEVIARSWHAPAEFAEIFDRHFDIIHRYLARRAGADAADDLASEVFTTAFARRVDYDVEYRSAVPWLYGIASNVLKAAARQRAKHDHAELTHDPDEARTIAGAHDPMAERVAAQVDAADAANALAAHLSALSDDDRATLLLYAWEDLTYPEIAAALGVPIGTVRSRLNRVRKRLREPLAASVTRTGRGGDTGRE